MADSDQQRELGKRSKNRDKGKRQSARKRRDGDGEFERHNLIAALNHKLRRQMLRRLNGAERPLSPCKLASEMKVPVTNLSYHMAVLRRSGAVGVVGEQQVRGAIEHFYESKVIGHPGVQAMLEETERNDEGQTRR